MVTATSPRASGATCSLVHDGTLYSPEGRNILRGVTRKCVLELATDSGIPVLERNLEPYDLLNADEAFFTSTSTCIMPMTRFEGQALGDGTPGPLTQRLMQAFNELVGLDVVAQAEAGAAHVAKLEGKVGPQTPLSKCWRGAGGEAQPPHYSHHGTDTPSDVATSTSDCQISSPTGMPSRCRVARCAAPGRPAPAPR